MTAALRASARGAIPAAMAEAAWLAAALLAPIAMNVASNRSFEAFKLTLIAPLAMLAGCCALADPTGLRRFNSAALKAPAILFSALIAAAALATVLSPAPGVAWHGDYARREGLVSWLAYAGFFSALLCHLRTRAQVHRLLDALAVAGVIPCVYALQQRYGFDFFQTAALQGGGVHARPGGTLGNPVFLGAWLLLAIPPCLARAITLAPGGRRRVWVGLVVLQVMTALVTQSRGPLLALGVALFLFAVVLGLVLHRRSLITGAFGVTLAFGGLLLALLFDPESAERFATRFDVPLIARLGAIGGGADLTGGARVGIWEAGVAAFAAAPTWRQLVGHGPDTAHFAYFAHLSPQVLRIEGYTTVIERLHNEPMELLMSFGLLGLGAVTLMFAAMVLLAAQSLSRVHKPGALALLAAMTLAGGAAGSAGAALIGGMRLLPLGAGLGVGLAFSVFLVLGLQQCRRFQNPGERADGVLLAAIICSLLGFWFESQVGVPTLATRLLVTFLLAMGLALAAGIDPGDAEAQAARHAPWLAGLALVAALAAFFPPLAGSTLRGPGLDHLGAILVPLACVVAAAVLLAPRARVATWVGWLVVPACAFVLIHAWFGRAVAGADPQVPATAITPLSQLALLSLYGLTLAYGFTLLGAARAASMPRAHWIPLGGALIAAGVAHAAGMAPLRADIWAKLAATTRSPAAALAFAQKAAETEPRERRHANAFASRLVDTAARDLEFARIRPDAGRQAVKHLVEARAMLARSLVIAAADPWVRFADVNALQLLALPELAAFQTESERNARLAATRAGFTDVQDRYPGHPWILRNWAQFEFAQGNPAAGSERLDAMERLDPLNPGAYTERARFAMLHGDQAAAIAALDRGIARIGTSAPPALETLVRLRREYAGAQAPR